MLDLLAVVPSVVFGLWGILVLAAPLNGFYDDVSDALAGIPVLGTLFAGPTSGRSFFTAGMILAIMITPIITSLAREVIETTPDDREGGAPGPRRDALGDDPRRRVRPHSKGGMVGAVTARPRPGDGRDDRRRPGDRLHPQITRQAVLARLLDARR